MCSSLSLSHQYQLHEVVLYFHNSCSFADELTYHPPRPNQSKNFRWFLLVVSKNTQESRKWFFLRLFFLVCF